MFSDFRSAYPGTSLSPVIGTLTRNLRVCGPQKVHKNHAKTFGRVSTPGFTRPFEPGHGVVAVGSPSEVDLPPWLPPSTLDAMSKDELVSMTTIGERLGLNRGSVWWHFQTKEDFPKPVYEHPGGTGMRLWNWSEVKEWAVLTNVKPRRLNARHGSPKRSSH